MLEPEQEQLIRLYLTQQNMKAACEIAGISDDQHYRWLRYDRAYQLAHKQATEAIIDKNWKDKHGGGKNG